MSVVSFYPGPGQVYECVPRLVAEAYTSGILFANHRSTPFMDLVAQTKEVLHEQLRVPDDYMIAFVSSATECWEIIAQSLVQEHMGVAYCGAFGRKWAAYAESIVPKLTRWDFDPGTHLPVESLIASSPDVAGIVHNETSNGTVITDEALIKMRKELPDDTLLAVDATSSMAGVKIDFRLADVWFASVQKCFGLPAGMAVLLLSPRAAKRARHLGRHRPYNALTRIIDNTEKNQAHHTPNILGIYLLCHTQAEAGDINTRHETTYTRYEKWVKTVNSAPGLSWLIPDDIYRSRTVLVLRVSDPEKIKAAALSRGIVLGNGYGEWCDSTIRIANFPAISEESIERVQQFLKEYGSMEN